ncbi:MAG: DNA polymerase III subunit beta [Thiohalospira sp.]
MKFGIQREALLRPLQAVSGVVERKQTMPILANILLTVSPRSLAITGTDLELELVTQVPLEGDVEEGRVTVPARKLTDIVRALPEDAEIRFEQEGEKMVVRSGRSRFTLATLPATEFPAMEAREEATRLQVPQGHLKGLLDRTAFAMAQQDVRYYLNGLLLEVGDHTLRSVATDGHRLALCECGTEHDPEGGIRAIVPRKAVTELAKLLGEDEELVDIEAGGSYLRFRLGDTGFTTKLIDGRFPDYEQVIPSGNRHHLTADRRLLRETLQRAAILSNEKYRGIRLEIRAGEVAAVAHNPEQEEAEATLEVDYNGPEMEIGFNASYLLDALGALDSEQARLQLADSNSSCLIDGGEEGDCRYVVMPMRI